eukprot:5134300-Prymnesium_polylepis.2
MSTSRAHHRPRAAAIAWSARRRRAALRALRAPCAAHRRSHAPMIAPRANEASPAPVARPRAPPRPPRCCSAARWAFPRRRMPC